MIYTPNIPLFPKDPSAALDFGFDLSPPAASLLTPWLAVGEQVTSLTVTPDAGLNVLQQNISANASGVAAAQVTAWLSGGVAGTTYNVRYQFTTNLGRTDSRSLQIQVAQR